MTTRESQKTICEWADQTFGEPSSNLRIATRANEEMAELLRALAAHDDNAEAVIEAADVVIVLYRLAERMHYDLHKLVDYKMEINRAREWNVSNDGHGYHVRDRS